MDELLRVTGWPSAPYPAALLIALAATAMRWERTRDRREAVAVALATPIVAFLVLKLSAVAMAASVPPWWSTLSIGAGLIACVAATYQVRNLFAGLVAGLVAAYGCSLLGPLLLVPFARYVVGYGLSTVVPLAAVALWVFGLTRLVRSKAHRTLWVTVAYVGLGAGAIVLLMSPVMSPASRVVLAHLLQAIVPCVLIVVVLGSQPRVATLLYSMAFLFVWIGTLIGPPDSSGGVNAIRRVLLTAPVAWAVSLALAAAIAFHVYRMITASRPRSPGIPIWLVVIPWISLVPAWYFFEVGLWPFLTFVAANFIAGAILISGFAFPVGPLDFRSSVTAGGRSGANSAYRSSSVTRSHAAQMQLLAAASVLGVAVVSYAVPWRWFATVVPAPVVAAAVIAPPGPVAPVSAPRAARVRLTTSPPGAVVEIDGAFKGVSPVTVTMSGDQRVHRARFVLTGYTPSSISFVAAPDAETRVAATLTALQAAPPALVLDPPAPPMLPAPEAPTTGSFTVSAPYPVEVRVQGRMHPRSSHHLISLPAGPYVVELAAPSVFLNLVRPIEIASGASVDVPVPPTVVLRAVCTIPGCTLKINGRDVSPPPPVDVAIAVQQEPKFELAWSDGRRLVCSLPITATSRFLFADPNNRQCAVRD